MRVSFPSKIRFIRNLKKNRFDLKTRGRIYITISIAIIHIFHPRCRQQFPQRYGSQTKRLTTISGKDENNKKKYTMKISHRVDWRLSYHHSPILNSGWISRETKPPSLFAGVSKNGGDEEKGRSSRRKFIQSFLICLSSPGEIKGVGE